ncbi:MAG: M50 family metallopeptidase [Clostridium sp.]|nr:M50 family metallopeptidase [Clostridium sp.]MDY3827206.1 M50 family metallopeptidase [Clostridium sp.]
MKYVLAVLALGVLIIVHELGHFIMAKVNKVKVIEFTIGMGPKIFTYQGKETKYCLSLFPVGGYVQMLGQGEESDDEASFTQKSAFRRFTIVIAGVVMNFILAIILFTVCICHSGYITNDIKEINANGPAAQAGMEVGDTITEVNGSKVLTYVDYSIESPGANGEDIKLKVDRNGESKELTIKPELLEEENRYIIGVTFDSIKEPTVLQGFKQSFKESGSLIMQTMKVFGRLITGRGNFATDLGGPVTVINLSAGAAEAGMWDLMNLVAILSISLAVFNILPIPALDGGWSVMLIIEMITRKKVPQKVTNVLNTIFFILLMLLVVAVTIKDILYPISY